MGRECNYLKTFSTTFGHSDSESITLMVEASTSTEAESKIKNYVEKYREQINDFEFGVIEEPGTQMEMKL